MADKELGELGGGVPVDSANLVGSVQVYIVTADGSRMTTLEELKTFFNTDPTVVPASEPFRGALAYRSSDVSLANSTPAQVSWNAESYDTDAIWSVGAPTRLTVPTGVTKVRLACVLSFPTNSGVASASIIKNGDTGPSVFPGQGGTRVSSGSTAIRVEGHTAVISVTAGDYFEVRATHTFGSAQNLLANSWFAMEIVEASI